MRRRITGLGCVVSWLVAAGCVEPIASDGTPPASEVAARFDLSSDDFWASPFPSDHRVREDTRRPDVSDFPNPEGVDLIDLLVGLVDDAGQGWARSGAITLPLTGPVLPGDLPADRAASTDPDASVFLIDLDEDSPQVGERVPADIVLRASDSPYGPATALVALPLQGQPLRPRTRYAMVARQPLAGPDGLAVSRPPAIAALLDGQVPEGWREDVAEQYLDALRVLSLHEVDPDEVVTLTVFTTSRPTADFLEVAGGVRAECDQSSPINDCPLRFAGPPVGSNSAYAFDVNETTDDFCVYEGRIEARSYQAGEPPYAPGEGGWVFDDDGQLEQQNVEFGRIFVTVPRSATPGDALPAMVFVRTGGGGDRPLLDRGFRTEAGTDDGTLTGYAAELARAGWIGVQVDGPLGGERNVSGADEQFQIFDIDNPIALRDNLRQSALELVALPSLLRRLRFSPAICPYDGLDEEPGPFQVRIDPEQLAIFGHSMGATIAPLAVAAQPAYQHVILSGAGGSWIDNIVTKERPVATAPLAAGLLREDGPEDIDRFHPALTLLQWAGEPAEPFLYAPRFTWAAPLGQRRNVLMVQGLVDRYILPPVANAMSLAMQLDLAGPAFDAQERPGDPTWDSLRPYTGAEALALPAWGNEADGNAVRTSVLVQHLEDDVEGGHEVVYQKPAARWQVRCFLETIVTAGVPVVGAPGQGDDPCDVPPPEE